MSAVGTLPWARRRGGRLTVRDRFLFVASALRSRARRRREAGHPPALRVERLDLAGLRFIDSALVKRTFEHAEEVYQPWLLNHCIRTYYWGGLLGQLESLNVDREELLVASLCHDLALACEPRPGSEKECFAVRGAEMAEALLHDHERPALAPTIAESITMHLNIAPAPVAPPYLNYLLQQGASIDVVGWDLAKVSPRKAEVVAQYPRLDLKKHLVEVLSREAEAHPGARLAMMVRFGFFQFIADAPYEE